MAKRINISTTIIHLILGFAAIICIMPIIHTIAISLSDASAAAAGIVYFFPVRFTLASYSRILSDSVFGRSFMISVYRVLAGVCISLPMTISMAYALSKSSKAFRERNIVMWIVVFTMLFGGGLIPSYITIKTYGLIDTFWVMVIPGALAPMSMVILMNFFRGVPAELEEAAIIDGAGVFRTMILIYLPISLPSIATITLFSVVGHWNDFFTGMIYMNRPENWPLQTYLRTLSLPIEVLDTMDPQSLMEYLKVSGPTFNAAKIFVAMIPIIAIYPFLQRYFVSGLVMGSVKE